jgi:hypothetical protein
MSSANATSAALCSADCEVWAGEVPVGPVRSFVDGPPQETRTSTTAAAAQHTFGDIDRGYCEQRAQRCVRIRLPFSAASDAVESNA